MVAALSVSGLQAIALNVAGYDLNEPVIYSEGIGLDGSYVVPDGVMTYTGDAKEVLANWSDDLIFHQFPAGQKVRTEVFLRDTTLNAAVYTLSAHFKIEKYDADPRAGGVVIDTIYASSIADGMWVDGPSDAYTAEVNQEGVLLYGYNWDTRGCGSGWFRLTFWIQEDPKVNPLDGVAVSYTSVDITAGSPGDTDTTAGTMYGFVGYDFASDTTWLDMYLYPKTSGRH